MTRRNVIVLTIASLLVLIVVMILLLVQNLDGVVKRAIERYGSETAGTAVRVDDVSIALRKGRGTLRGLTVANPTGFSATPLFALNDITLTISPGSLASEVPVVDELRIGATAFRYELDQAGRSNLGVLQKQMKNQAREGVDEQKQSSAKRIRIKRLVIADGEAIFELGQLGIGRATARVPGVTLTDLGGKRGLTPQELSKVVLEALTKNLEKSVSEMGLQRLLRGKSTSVDQAIRGLLNR
jgi:hypothetical protein